VLYDIGVVSTPEPFRRLVSQGMILGEVEYGAHVVRCMGFWGVFWGGLGLFSGF